jgi:hypothetical protein
VAEIEGALDRLAAGQPWLVQIVGEPGIGKSRLLSELCRRGEDRGLLVLDGRAAEFELDIPFGLIVDALNDYLGSLESALLKTFDEDLLAEMASVFPAVPRYERVEASLEEPAERYRLHYAIRTVLERLTTRKPMLLALDDVHWADAASVEVLAHLLRRFRGPLLTALAYRQPPARLLGALEAAGRAGGGTRLDLEPLNSEDAALLIGDDLDDVARAVIYRESGGNPFYIEQLARAGRGRPLRTGIRPEPPSGLVPRAVIASIRQELGVVGKESRLTLQAAAVAGESFEPELVGAIAERDENAVLAAVDELVDQDFIRPTRRAVSASATRSCAGPSTTRSRRDGGSAPTRGPPPPSRTGTPPPSSRPTTWRARRPWGTSRRSRCCSRRAATPPRALPRRLGGGCSRRPGCSRAPGTMSVGSRCSARRPAR